MMIKYGFVMVVGAIVALSVTSANARKPYFDVFKGKYYKPDGTDTEKEFAEKVDTVKCMICHDNGDMKVLNDYGNELGKLLKKQNNKQRILAAIDKVHKLKVPCDPTETFGERIKAGKLPGGE